MEEEGAILAQAPYGITLLNAIGKSYQSQAQIILGNMFSSGLASLKYHGRVLKGQFKAVKLAFKAFKTHQEIVSLEEKLQMSSVDDQPTSKSQLPNEDRPPSSSSAANNDMYARRAEIEEKALPIILDTMWAINAIDIDTTLSQVCRNVLREKNLATDEQRRRAEALYELGTIFRNFKKKDPQAAASDHNADKAKEKMETAFKTVMDKQMKE